MHCSDLLLSGDGFTYLHHSLPDVQGAIGHADHKSRVVGLQPRVGCQHGKVTTTSHAVIPSKP